MKHKTTKARVWQWAVCGFVAGLTIAGCGYGEVTPRGYDYAKALYSICNRRDAGRLEEFAQLLESDVRAGDVSEREADWLREIADQARSGEWSSAQLSARKLLEEQVEGR